MFSSVSNWYTSKKKEYMGESSDDGRATPDIDAKVSPEKPKVVLEVEHEEFNEIKLE
jgi:hypothetical protein